MNIRGLYYITHIDNLSSILKRGILCHERIDALQIQNTPIYDIDLVNRRKERNTPDGKNLWHYVNLFFQPRNSMLYGVIKSNGMKNIAVLGISRNVLDRQGIFITNGIAWKSCTQIYRKSMGMQFLEKQQEILQNDDWIDWLHSSKVKNQLMAECLVPKQVETEYIRKFIVADKSVADSIKCNLSNDNIQKLVVAANNENNIFTPFSKKTVISA